MNTTQSKNSNMSEFHSWFKVAVSVIDLEGSEAHQSQCFISISDDMQKSYIKNWKKKNIMNIIFKKIDIIK